MNSMRGKLLRSRKYYARHGLDITYRDACFTANISLPILAGLAGMLAAGSISISVDMLMDTYI